MGNIAQCGDVQPTDGKDRGLVLEKAPGTARAGFRVALMTCWPQLVLARGKRGPKRKIVRKIEKRDPHTGEQGTARGKRESQRCILLLRRGPAVVLFRRTKKKGAQRIQVRAVGSRISNETANPQRKRQEGNPT